MDAMFKAELKRLKDFTKNCKPDMHEPDEEGITAEYGPRSLKRKGYRVTPDLDNATCDELEMGFWLKNDNEGKKEWFNLACIVALARMAK